MIKLNNGCEIEAIAASGSLGFDGRGWFWEWILRWLGLLNPHFFTIVSKTVLLYPKAGNLKMSAPWRTVKLISARGKTIHPLLALGLTLLKSDFIQGTANAVGLTNPGLEEWIRKAYPVIEKKGYKVIVSITGTKEECIIMAKRLNSLKHVIGIEFNASCANANHCLFVNEEAIIETCKALKETSRHPIVLKLSCTQPYTEIAKATEGIIDAISINSVPWIKVFPNKPSPLAKYGGGAVSGKIIQPIVWKMAFELKQEVKTPVIAPSVSKYEDIQVVLGLLGCNAYHIGTAFLLRPWEPTFWVKKWMRKKSHMNRNITPKEMKSRQGNANDQILKITALR